MAQVGGGRGERWQTRQPGPRPFTAGCGRAASTGAGAAEARPLSALWPKICRRIHLGAATRYTERKYSIPPSAPRCTHVAQAHPRPRVPELTACVARAAFPDGNPYLRLRDELGPSSTTTTSPPCSPARTAGGAPLAAGPGHRPAVRRGALRSPGRRRRPRPHRLEVRPRPGADRPRLRLLRPLRVPRPPDRRRGRAAAAGGDARDLQGPRPGQGPRQAAHRLDPRPGRHPHLNRLELVGETLRAALNSLATVAPQWLRRGSRPSGSTAMPPGSRSRACPRARRPATPTARPSAPTGSGCSRPSPARRAAVAGRGPGRGGPAAGLAVPVLPRRGPGALEEGGGPAAGGPADRLAVRPRGDLRQQAEHDLDRLQGPPDRDLRGR